MQTVDQLTYRVYDGGTGIHSKCFTDGFATDSKSGDQSRQNKQYASGPGGFDAEQ